MEGGIMDQLDMLNLMEGDIMDQLDMLSLMVGDIMDQLYSSSGKGQCVSGSALGNPSQIAYI